MIEHKDDRAIVAAEIQHLARGKHLHATIQLDALAADFKNPILEKQAIYNAIDAQKEAAKVYRWARTVLEIL